MLFSALVMRYVSKKSTSNKCGKQVFSVLASAYFRGPVTLKYIIYPSTSTLNISQYLLHDVWLTNLLLIYYLHTPWINQFLGHENGKQLQVTTIKMTESKENKSIHRLDLPGSTGLGGGDSCPPCPPLLVTPLLTILRYFQTTEKGKVFQTTYQARLALALSIISTSAKPAGKP